jgi:DNA-binding transcriptional ArsR family regulator
VGNSIGQNRLRRHETRPHSRISNLVDAGIAQRQTATRYLDALAEAGIMDTARQGKTKLFVNKRLLALLLTDTEVWQQFK